MSNALYSPYKIGGLTLANRLVLSPMCQYSAIDGFPTDWHRHHYLERALGGAGLVVLEATAVVPEGRISSADLGIWDDAHASALAELVRLVHAAGAKIGIQLAHAGRKASVVVPWGGNGSLAADKGGWPTVAPSALPFDEHYTTPGALDEDGIARVIQAFSEATKRSLWAGFDVVEIHSAHGYLLHQFLTPFANQRQDGWGGSLENRMRLSLEVAKAVRSAWPEDKALFVRLSATDWKEGGWDLESSITLSKLWKSLGVDLIDVSSGGAITGVKITLEPGYQVHLAQAIREKTGLPSAAVGLITEAEQSRAIIDEGKADLIFLGRLLLRDPYWPARNAPADHRNVPVPYLRGFPV